MIAVFIQVYIELFVSLQTSIVTVRSVFFKVINYFITKYKKSLNGSVAVEPYLLLLIQK